MDSLEVFTPREPCIQNYRHGYQVTKRKPGRKTYLAAQLDFWSPPFDYASVSAVQCRQGFKLQASASDQLKWLRHGHTCPNRNTTGTVGSFSIPFRVQPSTASLISMWESGEFKRDCLPSYLARRRDEIQREALEFGYWRCSGCGLTRPLSVPVGA
ncbi:hypothetical protein PM082_007950 [Marasmius tenuissimus]|nr:hypothetical protein PM082_007950 [Marasmius tenuissimus]